MSWKNAEPDIAQSLRNMRDKLAELLTKELGSEWVVRKGETPAMYAHRYLTHIGSASVSQEVTIPAGETVRIRVGPDPGEPDGPPGVLAHAIRELYVRWKIEEVRWLQQEERRAWQQVILSLGQAITASQNAMKNRTSIAAELPRIPFMAEMSAVRASLEEQFPPAGDDGLNQSEDPREYARLIAFAAEQELHPAFGDAEISRMIIDGLPRDGRTPEARLRARRKRHANKIFSEGLQTPEGWVVTIDDQE